MASCRDQATLTRETDIANRALELSAHFAIAAAAVVGAGLSAVASGLGVFAVIGDRAPFWLAESATTAVAAAVWMMVVQIPRPRLDARSTVLFLIGAGVTWLFCRTMGAGSSPYHGLVAIITAMAAASVAWTVFARPVRAASIAVPVLTMVVLVGASLTRPDLGVRRVLTMPNGTTDSLSMSVTSLGNQHYLWGSGDLVGLDTVAVEFDAGSGAGRFRLHAVDSTTRARVCSQLVMDSRAQVVWEIANGHIPALVTIIPFRVGNCAHGQVWLLVNP